MLDINGVIGICNIHIWSLEGETDIFTAHVILDNLTIRNQPKQTKQRIKEILQKHHIEHSTIEIESRYHCTGAICEKNQKNNNQFDLDYLSFRLVKYLVIETSKPSRLAEVKI